MPAAPRPRIALRSAFAALTLLASLAHAQPTDRDYYRRRAFDMPFHLGPKDIANTQQLKLYIKPEQGGAWELHATVSPAQTQYDPATQSQIGRFEVLAPSDGTFQFAIMQVFKDGTSMPQTVDALRTDKTVTIDTKPPEIVLRPLTVQRSSKVANAVVVGIDWRVTDETLVRGGVRLEGRWFGAPAWTNFAAGGPAEESGKQEWTIPANQRMEVRLSAVDRAGNQASKIVTLSSGGGMVTGGSAGAGAAALPSRPNYRMVRDRNITLQYRARELPPSGIKSVDLYVTRLGGRWEKHGSAMQVPQKIDDIAEVAFEAKEDGKYGFAIVATSNAGQSQPIPKDDDLPQLWVELDSTPPTAALKFVRLVNPSDNRTMVMEWKASDKNENLEVLPIIFEYAEFKDGKVGEWQSLSDALPNSGRYICPSPQLTAGSYQFMVRMNVFDKAGNVTTVNHPTPISLDVMKPQVEITDVKSARPAAKPPQEPPEE